MVCVCDAMQARQVDETQQDERGGQTVAPSDHMSHPGRTPKKKLKIEFFQF